MNWYKIIFRLLVAGFLLGNFGNLEKQALAKVTMEITATKETMVGSAKLIGREETFIQKIKQKQGDAVGSDIVAKILEDSSTYGKYSSAWITMEGEAVQIPKRKPMPSFSSFSDKEQKLPDTFDLREQENQGMSVLPTVRNQKAYGVCWAMAGLESIESNVLMQGLSYRDFWLTDEKLQFSPSHLGWYLFENPPEGDGANGDYLERAYKGADGSDATAVMTALSSGYGVQLERNAPYSHWNYGQSKIARDTSYYQLRDANFLDSANTQEARKIVKQWIVSQGAVETGLYFSQQKQENCYYQEQYDATYGNHEVVLVGWDDHYSKENFKENGAEPEYDGAWIAQNSYGVDWGEAGYFYISYEEPSLFGFISYQMAERKDGEKCYQYDGVGGWLGVSSASLSSAANVFTAAESEELQEVGVSLSELNSSGADYRIQIYKWKKKKPLATIAGMVNAGDMEKETLPEFSEEYCIRDAETEGTFEYPGYHKIALKMPVLLEEGETFAIVLTLLPRDARSQVYYSFEGSIESYDMDMVHYGFKKGQTYYLKGFGEQAEWKDITSIKKKREGFELGNLNVKAFTYTKERAEKSDRYQEQKVQLEETIKTAEEFLDSLGTVVINKNDNIIQGKKAFAFTKGNQSYNRKLILLLKETCDFAKQTLLLEEVPVYEISNAYNSLAAAMDYMSYPAKLSIKNAKQLYQLSEQTSKLVLNALSLVSIEKNLVMNPDTAFTFGKFDTEQEQGDKGVILNIQSKKTKTFYPIGGRGGIEFILEGNGHSISGMVCSTKTASNTATGSYVGLIGMLTGDGIIRNLTIKNSYIEGNYCVGAFAGALAYGGKIEKCTMKNTFVYGYEQIVDNFYLTAASHIGGLAGIVASYSDRRRSGIYQSAVKECLIYGEFLTGGIVGAVNSGASAGTGNTIWNSSIVGIATYGESHSGVGLYLGGEAGNEKDPINQAEIKKHYIFNNSSAEEKDYLLINIYKPKHFTGENQMLLFIQPYDKAARTLRSVFLKGIAKKKKRGKSYIDDGWHIKGMAGDITVTPMTRRLHKVNFYSSLTGKILSSQSVVRGSKVKAVKAPKIKGYHFLGWYDLAGNPFDFSRKVKVDKELYTLYEKSKKNKK